MTDRRVAAGLFVLALVTFGWFFGGAGWNQDAHFDLARALVERQTLDIDGYDVNTGDVSRGRDGHTFINKPPGVSFLAAIPYAVVYGVEQLLRTPLYRMSRTNAWIVTAATCGVCGALIAPVIYLFGRRRVGATAVDSLAVALVTVFGTIVFAYSTMLFAHVPAALFLLLAVTLIGDPAESNDSGTAATLSGTATTPSRTAAVPAAGRRGVSPRPFLAGICAGLATTCFYICGIGAIALAIAALFRSRRAAVHFLAGGVPFAIALGVYQWRCFGSALRTSVEGSVQFAEKGLLFGVLRMPRPDALYGITFSPYRGLFFASPVLLLAFVGFFLMWRDRAARPELFAIATTSAAFVLIIAAFNGWHGGWAFGPRYILPIVPLLAIALLYAMRVRSRRLRLLFFAVALLSVTLNFLATATDAMPSDQLRDPIGHYVLPAFFTGRIPEATRRCFPWYGSVNVDKVSLPRDAGNLGESLFGEGTRSSVAPIALWLVAGSAALLAASRRLDAAARRAGLSPARHEPSAYTF